MGTAYRARKLELRLGYAQKHDALVRRTRLGDGLRAGGGNGGGLCHQEWQQVNGMHGHRPAVHTTRNLQYACDDVMAAHLAE